MIAVSHTRAAAAEIAGRNAPIPEANVGTLHSFAFDAIGRPVVCEDTEHLREFCDEHPAWEMSAARDAEELAFGAQKTSSGDEAMAEYARLRNLCADRSTWPFDVVRFAKAWEDYKAQTGTVDFTDMIELAAQNTDSPRQCPSVMVVDECQDTSRLQWQLVNRWASHPDCEKLVTAGDPDQAIFVWAGAEPRYFSEVQPTREKVLEQSYRVPAAVHRFAQAWIRQIPDRRDVTYMPRDHKGAVRNAGATYKTPEQLLWTIESALTAGKTVMVQASCAYMLHPLLKVLRREAIPFANPWRLKEGSWNPLARRGENSTVEAIAAFLAPHTTGRPWSKPDVQRWAALVKGVFTRGGREEFARMVPDNADPYDVLDDLARYMQSPEDLSVMLQAPPECLKWLRERLCAAKQGPATFPLQVVEERGPGAIQEEPRLFVGSCHSFKGAESDVVIVFPDLSMQGYTQWVGGQRDEIIRLFYVAATRAREELHLCAPCTGMAVWS